MKTDHLDYVFRMSTENYIGNIQKALTVDNNEAYDEKKKVSVLMSAFGTKMRITRLCRFCNYLR